MGGHGGHGAGDVGRRAKEIVKGRKTPQSRACYDPVTDHELGKFELVPLPARSASDATKRPRMGASAWLFGFAENGTGYRSLHGRYAS